MSDDKFDFEAYERDQRHAIRRPVVYADYKIGDQVPSEVDGTTHEIRHMTDEEFRAYMLHRLPGLPPIMP